LFRYPAVEKLGDRLLQIYGREISEKLIPIRQEMDSPEFEMEGFVTLPPHSYGTRSMQELFVNGRPIKNQVIQHALYEAYASHLMKGQHPAYFLLIQLDPARVDVNVHPSKKEVRFSDSALIHQLVYKSVKRSLTQEMISQPGEPVYREIEQETVRENVNAFKVKEGLKEYVIRSVFNTAPDSANDRDLFRSDDLAQEPDFKVLGQFHAMFLLIQSGEELQIIDQHAAHERILFEKYRSGSTHDSRIRQPLLIPQTIEVTFKELLVLKEYERYFSDVGIELDIFGENAVVVRALPVYLAKADIRALLAQFIEEIEMFQGFSTEKEKREGMIATLACHAAIKAGQSLQHPEIAALFKELCKLETALTCPHGRPIKHNFSLTALEKMFCRI
jgi:DNA mismatch repair protein MutL